jgi:hypothetical protein
MVHTDKHATSTTMVNANTDKAIISTDNGGGARFPGRYAYRHEDRTC